MMTKFLKLFFAMITCVMLSTSVQATHVVGGEMKYKHIGADLYEVTLTFRRDCINGAPDAQFDNPAIVWIFNGNGNLQTGIGVNGRLKMNFNSSDTLNQFIQSDCGFEGTQVCVHETKYKANVRLPNNPGGDGYILTYQRCCRNATLENIVDPLLTGGTWSVKITPEAQELSNTSPDFIDWAPVYVCANENVNFDHSATDADGDSLVYKLCTPYTGADTLKPIPSSPPVPPYTPVVWKDPYGLDNLLGGVPIQIDPKTGLMTGEPNLVGQFLVGICVEEYRDGVKIGEVRRDFQYNVRICSDPPTAIFEANEGDCNGPMIDFDNQSLGGTSYQWNFDYPSDDPAFLSTEINPYFEYEEPGVYDVQLIVTRGADACSDTTLQSVAAIYSDIEVKYRTEIMACLDDGQYLVRLINQSEEVEQGFEITGANWEITQGDVTNYYEGNVVNLTIDSADLVVDLQVSSTTGCNKSKNDTLAIADFAHIADFDFELAGCSDEETATLTVTDISDSVNTYDTPVAWQWTVTENGQETMFTTSTISYDADDKGTITVELTADFGGGCLATVSKEINLEEVVPQASYELTPVGCPDDTTVELTFVNTSAATNPGYDVSNTTWSINVAGETFDGNMESITVNVPKDSVVMLTMESAFANGCHDSVMESFVPGPFATIHFDAEPFKVCFGDTVSFVSNPNSDFEYTWSPMDGLYFEDGNDLSNPSVIGTEDRVYTVTVSDGLCSIESSVMVEVLGEGNLMISGDSITCDGSVSLTASGGIGVGSFEWSETSDFGSIKSTGNTFETTFDGKSKTYYARFTGESCGDPYAEFTVQRSDIFDVVFNGSPVRVCLGDTVPLLANPNPQLTYEWSPIEGIYFAEEGKGHTAFVIGIKDTSYDVTISDDFCSIDTSISVVIADAQNFQVLGDSIICGDEVQLIGFGATGIGTYQWSLDPDFGTILYEGDTLNTTLEEVSDVYYVTFTDNTCGDLILSYNVRKFIFDLEYVDTYAICAGDSLTYTVFNIGEGPLTWSWSSDPHVIGMDDSSMPMIGVGIDETESFELIFVATSPSGCEYSDTIEFVIDENPIVDFDYSLENCGEYKVCFDIDTTFNGFPSWDFGDTLTNSDVSLVKKPCYTYPGPGVYEVRLTNLSSVCPFADVVKTVTINDAIIIDPIDDRIVCEGEEVILNVTSPSNAISFVWCNLQGDTLTTGTEYKQIVNNPFDVVVKAEDPNGCFTMDTVNVKPFVFNIEDNVPDIFCSDEQTNIEILVNGTQEGYIFQWSPDDGIISGGNTGNPVLQTGDAREYSVMITFDSLGCETVKNYDVSTTSFEVMLDAIDLEGNNSDTINKTEEVTIYVEDQMSDWMYDWSSGEMNETGEITVSPEETATFVVTVTDEMGCTATDSLTIFVRQPKCDATDVFLPTAFTPNGDDVNDILYLRSNFIDKMELWIYDRWGEEVFYSKDQGRGWDGTYNGAKLSPDVYAYTLRVTCINQVEFALRGNVSLMK